SARFGAFAFFTKPIGGAVAVVRAALSDEHIRRGAMPVVALRLRVRRVRSADPGPFVPRQPEPSHPVEDAVHHFGGRALCIRIFDAENKGASVAPREEPVEERGARAADVQIAGGRGSEADARSRHAL